MRKRIIFARKLQIAIPFIWFGAVMAISFMEAPLKFNAPGIDLKLGLGIGSIVFHALNKVELILCLIFGVSYLIARPKIKTPRISFWIVVIILLIQTFVLYPILDERTAKVIAGTAKPYSNTHLYYIATEVIKVFALLVLGFSSFGNLLPKPANLDKIKEDDSTLDPS